MTVKELINYLSTIDENAEVWIYDYNKGCDVPFTIEDDIDTSDNSILYIQ